MDASTIASLLKPMNSTQIINTLTTLEKSGFNVSSVDIPSVLSTLNVTQIEGLLESNSTVVNGLLQSLSPVQLVTVMTNFQNVTSNLFLAGKALGNTTTGAAYTQTGKTLLSLFMEKLNNTFTNAQILGVFSILSNGAALGTGSKKLLGIANDLMNGFTAGLVKIAIPSRLLNLVEDYQPSEFGDYPTTKDIAPSSIFMAIFFILTFVHLGIFAKNYSLGHKFFVSLGLAIYSLVRALGFLLRIVWSKDITKIETGLASMIFIVLPTAFLPGLNLIMAQRIFTWRHPVRGSSKLFMNLMYLVYAVVVVVVVMTIIAACVQVDYLLGEHHFKMTKQVIQASSILILVYSLLAVILIASAYIIKPSKLAEEVLTYQPYWIKSFRFTYFVPKGAAAQEAKLAPASRKNAIRVIHSTEYQYNNDQEKAPEAEGTTTATLKQHHSISIIAVTTFLIFIGDIFRCVSTFIEQYKYAQSWIFKPVVMYVLFGALETIVNLIYIFGRIDLRFYKPDSLKNVKAVEQDAEHSIGEESKEEKEVSAVASN